MRTVGEWMERLQGAGIPSSPVRTFEDVVGQEQSAVREMFPTLQHPTAGAHRVTGTPVKLSETPGGPGLPAPLLGQHTRETLGELLGLSAGEVDGLAARGVVYEAAE
jgi:crotonobetainyl-CoA:carnitine CoA-transferase CaiB-like acyl-CoA transferase